MSESSTTKRNETESVRGCQRRGWLLFPLGLGVCVVAIMLAGPGCHRGEQFAQGIGEEGLRRHLEVAVELVLSDLEATELQQEEIEAILDDGVTDFVSFRDEGRALRQEFHLALQAEELDPVEIERIRSDMVNVIDRASLRGVEVLLDTADVLTPEQRQQLIQRHQQTD